MGADDPRWIKMAELCGQGVTLKEIGQAVGLTRERVRQLLLKRPDLEDTRRSVRIENLERLLASIPPKPVRMCKVCGVELSGRRTVYCSETCYKKAQLSRYQDDPEYRNLHKESLRRYRARIGKDEVSRQHMSWYRKVYPLETLQCPVCGVEFKQYTRKQKYCSKRCSWRSKEATWRLNHAKTS